MQRIEVDKERSVLELLVERGGLKRSTAKDRLRDGAVSVDGVAVTRAEHRVRVGAEVMLGTALRPLSLGLRRVYEDEAIIVVDKPAGLLSVPTKQESKRCAEEAVRRALGPKVQVTRVHRLDRETSGLLIFAKDKDAAEVLMQDWSTYDKRYLAIGCGVLQPPTGEIDAPLRETKSLDVVVDEAARGERDAITAFRTIKVKNGRTLFELQLLTGRKHQIRVHLAYFKAPVLGDRRYGGFKADRLMLHAHRFVLTSPTGKALNLFADPPRVFSRHIDVPESCFGPLKNLELT